MASGLASAPAAASSFPSDDCDVAGSTVVVDGSAAGFYARLRFYQPDPQDLWVCFRADNGGRLEQGGKLVISSMPNTSPLPVPQVDPSWQSCPTTGSMDALPHPLLSASLGDPSNPATYETFYADDYLTNSQAAICFSVTNGGGATAQKRLLVPLPLTGVPSVTFLSDPPGVHIPPPTPAPPGLPSSTCENGTGGVLTQLVNENVGGIQTWFYVWQESNTRIDVCVRTEGAVPIGGRLTVDASRVPGLTPTLATSPSDMTPCTMLLAHLDSPIFVDVRQSPLGTNPASLCLTVGTTAERVTVGTSGSLTPPDVTWTQDPS